MKTCAKHMLLIPLVLILTGCYPGITGKVVDAETGKPIRGALVLAQWTQGHGLGFTYHTVYKTIETETNAEGAFSLSGVYRPLIDPPRMLIFSQGYVPWRNDRDFEKKRTIKK